MSKLVSMTIVHNEAARYLPAFLTHLLTFCDELRVIDDGSTDATPEILLEAALEEPRLQVERLPRCQMFEHEGHARQLLLDFTMIGNPDVILAIDADEFVSDPHYIRDAADDPEPNCWTLRMEEVWKLDERQLWTRQDGGWRPHLAPIMFRVPGNRHRRDWRIADRQMASGRTPTLIRHHYKRAADGRSSVLHFGWARQHERQARYQRYVEHDGGRFHQSRHLQSIMWTDRQVRLKARPWPEALQALRAQETAL